jgi:HEAT repeat protein
VASPTAATVEALESLRSDPDVGVQATFGLGSALHRLADQDPALAAETRTALTDQLARATAPGQQAAVLTALGNAGDPATLDTIRAYLTSDSDKVRAAAAQALRRITGADADQLLATLCTDPSGDVRLSAVDAAGERMVSAVLANTLAALVVGEPLYQVRAKVVNILAQWSRDAPSAAAALAIVASRDPNADLRSVAHGALTR